MRILIYEDNPLLRESLTGMIDQASGYSCVGAFAQAGEIISQLRDLQPELILMDIDMPGITGIDALQLLRKEGLNTPVIMLTVFEDHENVLSAIESGASGYLLKRHISSRLFSGIEEVISGGAPLSPTVAKMLLNKLFKFNKPNSYGLTERETEILSELSKGNSYKMIAGIFAISIDTVRTHIKHIYDKLQVHSQTEAVSKAINERLV